MSCTKISLIKMRIFHRKLVVCSFFLTFVIFVTLYSLNSPMPSTKPRNDRQVVTSYYENAPVTAAAAVALSAKPRNKFGLTDDFLVTPFPCLNKQYTDKLMIIVTSRTNHFKEREMIRKTWGTNRNVDVFFILGTSDNRTVMSKVGDENAVYNDLIVKDFCDSFYNLTLKVLSAFEWAYKCTKCDYLLKTDDDVFINVPLLLKHVRTLKVTEKKIYGNLASKWMPIRKNVSKYHITIGEYPKTYYPDFVTGPAYLINYKCIYDLFTAAFNFNYFKLEDVFFTGIVAENLKINRTNDRFFTNQRLSATKRFVCKYINIHKASKFSQKQYYEFVDKNLC